MCVCVSVSACVRAMGVCLCQTGPVICPVLVEGYTKDTAALTAVETANLTLTPDL